MRSNVQESRTVQAVWVKSGSAFECPPVGEPLGSLLAGWHEKHPNVVLTVSEMNDRDLAAALQERRLDAALIPGYALWPHAVALPIYRERLVATLPAGHPLARRETLDCASLRNETVLVQGWDGKSGKRKFFPLLFWAGNFIPHGGRKRAKKFFARAGKP